MAKSSFAPDWAAVPPGDGTFRQALKWGAPDRFVHPNRHLYAYLKSELGLTDSDFRARHNTGDYPIRLDAPPQLPQPVIDDLRSIVGADNVKLDDCSRLKHAYGKSMLDLLRLRAMRLDKGPDAVVRP